MGFGAKIKELRIKEGLTQKDLADKLFVTYQAVSKWENDDAEPSISTIKEICKVLNCDVDYLLDIERSRPTVEEKKEVEEKLEVAEPQVVETVEPDVKQELVKDPTALAICPFCKKNIFNKNELKQTKIVKKIVENNKLVRKVESVVCCKDCKKVSDKKFKEDQKSYKFTDEYDFKKRRVISFVWASIFAALFLAIAIWMFATNSPQAGGAYLVIAILMFPFVASVILDNNFVSELWREIASFGFVRMPGIIFEFSLDGFIFLIAMKVLFAIIGFLLAVAAFILATVIALPLSLISFPIALKRNLKHEE